MTPEHFFLLTSWWEVSSDNASSSHEGLLPSNTKLHCCEYNHVIPAAAGPWIHSCLECPFASFNSLVAAGRWEKGWASPSKSSASQQRNCRIRCHLGNSSSAVTPFVPRNHTDRLALLLRVHSHCTDRAVCHLSCWHHAGTGGTGALSPELVRKLSVSPFPLGEAEIQWNSMTTGGREKEASGGSPGLQVGDYQMETN